ncbi:MAG: hypothetical protein GVY12_14355 [Bacteroidetes bacterium]|jgi:hypothetical protein|nr:hypothetical protein [Bacteroidota bacterium]
MSNSPSSPPEGTPPDATPDASPLQQWDWRPKLRWFAAEIVVVVCGILIAIALNAWWADRQTLARSAVFTARLTEDVRHEAWRYAYSIEYNKDVLAGAATAIIAWLGDSSIADEAFLIGAYRATQMKPIERRRATYDQLISTGEIGLITDDTLRTTAISVFNFHYVEQIVERTRTSDYRALFRRTVPADVQRELLASCGDRVPEPGDYEAIVGSLGYACTLRLPPEQIAAAAASLRSTPAALPALRLHYANLTSAVNDLNTMLPTLRSNLRQIAGRD